MAPKQLAVLAISVLGLYFVLVGVLSFVPVASAFFGFVAGLGSAPGKKAVLRLCLTIVLEIIPPVILLVSRERIAEWAAFQREAEPRERVSPRSDLFRLGFVILGLYFSIRALSWLPNQFALWGHYETLLNVTGDKRFTPPDIGDLVWGPLVMFVSGGLLILLSERFVQWMTRRQ